MQPRGQSEKPSSVPRAGLFAQPFCFRISIPPVSHQNCEKSKIMKLPVPVHPLLYADCTFKASVLCTCISMYAVHLGDHGVVEHADGAALHNTCVHTHLQYQIHTHTSVHCTHTHIHVYTCILYTRTVHVHVHCTQTETTTN